MTETIKKAIAGLVAGIATFLASINLLPADFNTPEVVAGVTSVVTLIAALIFGNKDETPKE